MEKTNTAWLELGKQYMETMYEQGRITEMEYLEGMRDYEKRLTLTF